MTNFPLGEYFSSISDPSVRTGKAVSAGTARSPPEEGIIPEHPLTRRLGQQQLQGKSKQEILNKDLHDLYIPA